MTSNFPSSFPAESPHSFTVSSAGGSPDKLKSVNEMEKRLDRLEKDNFNLRMKLFYQQESLASQKSEQDMAKEIVELKVGGWGPMKALPVFS